jgi:hypothetical protein
VKEQYGFRINSSTEVASYNIKMNVLLIDMNNRLSIGVILCDFEKVFDCGNHCIIVDKLDFSEISGKFLSYLRVR